MHKRYLLIIFMLLLSNLLLGQFKLINEELEGKTYRLYIESSPVKYEITKSENIKRIIFEEYIDESKPGSLNIPKAELFIAIPQNSYPLVKCNVYEKKNIEAYPYINPKINVNDDGKISFVNNLSWDRILENNFINNGVITIGNNYCLHLTVALFNYDQLTNSIAFNKKISIELKFDNEEQLNVTKSIGDHSVSSLIINKDFAAKYSSLNSGINYVFKNDWIDYEQEYLKLGLPFDAVYRIRPNDLIKCGIDVSQINPKAFQLFWKGSEVPIFVSGEDDNHFNANDFIEFIGIKNYGGKHREVNAYNTPYNEYLDKYYDTTIVWLIWGKQNGLRTSLHDITSGSVNSSVNYYSQVLHYEKNIWFDFSTDQLIRRQLPDWTENETWLWNTQGVGSMDLAFNVSNLIADKKAKAFIKLQSYAADINQNAHQVGLSINNDNKIYDSLSFDSFQQRIIKANFNSNLLANGSNKIKSVSFPTKATINSVFHDWYEIEYPRLLTLNQDSIQFKFNDYQTAGLVNYQISDYHGSSISFYKYGDMLNITRITNYNVQYDKLVFTDQLDSSKNYIIVPESKIITPKIYYKKKFKNLKSSSNSAEYLIITHPMLINSANEYSTFISQNYHKKVEVINVFDIYDEFNYGFFSPEPIKDFLFNAYNYWSGKKLEYVLLLGSANYDYYQYRQKQLPAPPHPNLVPSFGVPVSDNWFINWNSTSIYNPLIKIGRIPARAEEDVRIYLQKHKDYFAQKYSGLNKRFLFFSGGIGNDQNELNQLRAGNEFVIENYVRPAPIGGLVNHFFKTLNPNTNFGPYSVAQIQNAIDSSGLFISYLGHSGTQTWDNSITDAKQLKNSIGAYPLITDFGCSTAKFAEPDVTSFSELFVTSKEGQAICYIGNTSLGFTSSSLVAPKLFYETILKDSVLTISDALNKTKVKLLTQYGTSDVNKIFSLTNSLIGDPIISLKLPPKPNLKISRNDLSIFPAEITNLTDSARCIIKYFNTGRATNQNYSINIRDIYNNNIGYDKKIIRSIPLYSDSTQISFPTKDQPGEHQLSIELDSGNSINELFEDDNKIVYSIKVSYLSLRSMINYEYSKAIDKLKILNPSGRISTNTIDYQISSKSDFSDPIFWTAQLGEFYTRLNLPSMKINSRYWLRYKMSNQQNFELTNSFIYSDKLGYLLNDSLSFLEGTKINTVCSNNVQLGKETVTLEAISAGFNDGNTGVITKNNQNYIPIPNRGHDVCVFDGNTFELKTFQTFDLLFGGTAAQSSYAKLLDSLKTSDVLVIVVVDEGSINLNSSLKQKLKNCGSKYIDSLSFRDSWAFIGRKGLAMGKAAEAYAKIFKGRAIATTSFDKRTNLGYYITSFIGPAIKWKQFDVAYAKPYGTNLSYSLIGKTIDGGIDTLQSNILLTNVIDLSNDQYKNYPFLKLKLKFESSSTDGSPQINSIYNGYQETPELGLNDQVISVSKDTVEQGENISLKFNVVNAGEMNANNFKVLVEILNKNSKEKIFETMVDSIGAEQKKEFNVTYSTAYVQGQLKFDISIDPDKKILELYKDNNFYSVPVFVKPNTKPASLKLTFDGNDILDGDFVSANPNIKVELTDDSLIPIKDTSHVSIYLNNLLIPYVNNSTLSYSFSNNNPKFMVDFKPILSNGDYILKIIGKNASGQLIDSTGLVKKFSVKNEMELVNVYNYPNPFKDETYFTFRITQIPDEIKIKIFTITGRMIKEFILNASELKYDLNRIHWDGKDADGDYVANGVYLYKIISKKGSETFQTTQKLAIVR